MKITIPSSKELQIKGELQKWLKDSNQIESFFIIMTESQHAFHYIFTSSYFNLKMGKTRPNFIEYKNSLQRDLFQQTQRIPLSIENIKSKLHEQIQCFETAETEEIKIYLQFERLFSRQMLNQYRLQLWEENHQQNQESCEKTFRQIFTKLLDVYSIDFSQNLMTSVLQYGIKSLEHLKFQKGFTKEQIRQDLYKMLSMTQSFKELTRFGGNDIKKLQKEVQQEIQKWLIQSEIPFQFIEEIKKDFLQNPLSLAMNKMKILPQLKAKFLSSQFYTSGLLQRYAQALNYPQSIFAKAIINISQLLEQINQSCHVTNDIITMIYKFDLVALLQHPKIEPSKTLIYQWIKEKYPFFQKACQNVKYLGKKPSDLKLDDKITKKIQLRRQFLSAELKFQKWEETQNNLMDKKQSIIHDLQLTSLHKKKLREYYQEIMEPYFRKQQKSKSFREITEESLLHAFICSVKIKKKQVPILLEFVQEMIEVQSLKGSRTAKDLTENENQEMTEILKRNKEFQQFKKSKGVDKQEQEYQAVNKIKKHIYQINFQNKIEVSHESIQKFLQIFIENNMQIQTKLQFYVCDLKQLKKCYLPEQSIQINEENDDNQKVTSDIQIQTQAQIETTNEKPGNPNKIKQNLKILLTNFNTFLENQITKEESHVLNFRNENYASNKLQFAEILLKANPFQGQLTKLNQLGIKSTVTKKNIMKELKQLNTNILNGFLMQFNQIQTELNKMSKTQTETPNLEERILSLKNQKALIIAKFLKQYQSLDNPEEQTKFTSTIINKIKEPQEIIQKILDSNPFENKDVTIFDSLVQSKQISKVQKNNLLKEFQTSNKCNEIGKRSANDYKSIKLELNKHGL